MSLLMGNRARCPAPLQTELIRDACGMRCPVPLKTGLYRPNVDSSGLDVGWETEPNGLKYESIYWTGAKPANRQDCAGAAKITEPAV